MSTMKRSISYANVMATVAVFLAFTGAAVAVTKVAKKSVTSPSIKNGSVVGKDVKDDSLTGADVNESSLTLPVPNAGDGRPAGPAGGDLSGEYPNPVLGQAVVGTRELGNAVVTSAQIASGAVTTNGLANDSVTSAKIAAGAVVTDDLANDSVNGAKIANGTIGGVDLADQSVSSAKIVENSVTGREVGPSAVGTSELKGMSTATSGYLRIYVDRPQTKTVTCPSGRKVVGGGWGWQDDEPATILASHPSEFDPDHTWVVRAMVESGNNDLYVWANCLAI